MISNIQIQTTFASQRSIDIIIPVKNGGEELIYNIDKWENQSIPLNWQLYIYLVDDGSTDEISLKIKKIYSNNKKIKVIRNHNSKGRAKARNQGADAGQSEFIAFFDADCCPYSLDTIKTFIHTIEKHDSKIMFGSLKAVNNDFWGKYFQDVADRREKQFIKGDKAAFTTANCVFSREIFYKAGKFDERYTKYGFEDKDLILRLLKLDDDVYFVKNAQVIHNDVLSLKAVCRKMYIAGKYSSTIFQKDHPDSYKKMAFYKADVRNKKKLTKFVIFLLKKAKTPILLLSDKLLDFPLPYSFKAVIVKCCSGLYFSIGSSEPISDQTFINI
ncbi:glycosyltransferase family 2 protein [Acinetobacter celticus]|uniref:Glycosyltransferase 2-like domain-containing protein n=1 Tax=Acinetobacter celticus TaxID=1891224 RepID=A0A1C3CTS3_9GAMM|nr:glycosyltransferase family A protein [Acinetobacter celticus]ODA12140.1 hypothetical protein BBP83_11720 [Acinetobacter celticus]